MVRISDTEKEMEQAVDVLVNFNDEKAKSIADSLRDSNGPIYILGMGSSLLFPAKNAEKRASKLLPNRRVEIGHPNNFDVSYFPENAYVFLSSNSGRTVEILEVAEKLKRKGIKFFGVTAKPESNLAELCEDKYILQGEFERGVAATKSIIDQALFYDAVIHGIAQKEFPLGKDLSGKEKELTDVVKTQMKENFDRDVSKNILDITLNADTYYWADHDTGVCEELALKSCEIAGKRGIYQPGTQILHGIGEVIKPGDVILVGNYELYSKEDRRGFRKLADKVGAKIIAIEDNPDVLSLGAEVTPGFEGYTQLPAAWNVLRWTAHFLHRDIDHPEVAQKYREK